MEFQRTVPILRMFSVEKAKEFYLGFLGFKIDFEHRLEPHMPLYMGISRGGVTLHLSEHHGDGTPGSVVRIETKGLDELHAELIGKQYGYGRPGIEEQEWGERSLMVVDPFHNRLVFYEPN